MNFALCDYAKSPAGALTEALEAIKSEQSQLNIIAARHKPQLEAFFDLMKTFELSNRLAAALFKKVEQTRGTQKHERGASLIYALRCAIVHAGTKDIIFESYPDGDTLLGGIIEDLEILVCACNGIELQD